MLVLLATDYFRVEPFYDWYQSKPTLFIFFCLGIGIILSFLAVYQYLSSLKNLETLLSRPWLISNEKRLLRQMPAEIRDIYDSVNEKISSLLNAQAALVADKKVLDSILNNMSDGIVIANADETITLINPSACRIFGIEQHQAIGRSLAEGLRNYKVNELYTKSRRSSKQEMVSIEIPSPKAFIQCIATPLAPEMSGDILFLMQDITKIRQLEIIRQDFVSNVSHELRTPLASLKLIAETLLEGALNEPKVAKSFLESMDNEIENLIQLVEELLELSRIESGQVPLEKKWVNPYLLVNHAYERMLLMAERKGLKLRTEVQNNMPDIYVDPTRMEQALINLVHNAIKFTEPGGKIEIRAEKGENEVIIHVEDTGIGIPPKDLERIFERFYKTDRSRTEDGTGLGLSISKHLVEAHNGRIWVESQPGFGSKFSFSIPIK